MTIVIVGLPASGKTTVGLALAEKLNVPFLDTDTMIEDQAGKPIREIFADDGEEAFRAMEVQATRKALGTHPSVVSLGGGAVMNSDIRQMLRGNDVAWLDVGVTTLTRRAGMNQLRPLLLGDIRKQMEELASQRRAWLEEVATVRVDAENLTVDEEVAVILARISSDSPLSEENRAHEVRVGHGEFHSIGQFVSSQARVAIVCPTVLRKKAELLRTHVNVTLIMEVPDGEKAKSPQVLFDCWQRLAEAGLTRDDAIIGLGGGSTTDLAGFLAATYLRGVAYVAMPTTVLGMADAAVGGKTGINLPQGKNLVGSFYGPVAVLADLDFLDGLPETEIINGLAEVIKCGFISDRVILDIVQRDPMTASDPKSEEFEEILRRAIQVKVDTVSQDFREKGTSAGGIGREALNYGHTLGHAIEKVEGFTWSHGRAVALGMVCAAEISHRLSLIDVDAVGLHRAILGGVGLPTSYSGFSWEGIRSAMSVDKKARGSTVRFVLLEEIGKPVIRGDVDEDVLADSFAALSSIGMQGI